MSKDNLSFFEVIVFLTGFFTTAILACVNSDNYETKDSITQIIMIVLILLPVTIGFFACVIAAYKATD